MVSDPRPDIISQIDISAAKFEASSHPIVLLCGGSVKNLSSESRAIYSFRHAVKDCFLTSKFEFFLPEEIQDWLHDSMFANLLEYEADLAAICSLVVVIPESAGSIAELGAFSQLVELREKICVINSNGLADMPSFINLGILRFIKDKHPSRIKIYPWVCCPKSGLVEANDEIINDVINDIQAELDGIKKRQNFDKNKNTHVMALMFEVIEMFVALKESEIHQYLSSLGVSLMHKDLKRKLFLLMRFRLIKKQSYGDREFYMASDEKYHRVRFAYKPNSDKLNNLRISVLCEEYYDRNKIENHRRRAIRELWRAHG